MKLLQFGSFDYNLYEFLINTSRLLFYLVFMTLIFMSVNPRPAFSNDVIEKKWDELLKRDAFIYTVPRVNKPTPIDGVYIKTALKKGQIVPCRRCPDWLANPGVWRLYFKKGIYRIINTDTGWKSIGTYIVSKDRVFLANDSACIYDFGVYSFKFKDRVLTFDIIDDPCAIKLRGMNFCETDWVSCYPPNEEASITAHWPKPHGCR